MMMVRLEWVCICLSQKTDAASGQICEILVDDDDNDNDGDNDNDDDNFNDDEMMIMMTIIMTMIGDDNDDDDEWVAVATLDPFQRLPRLKLLNLPPSR